MESTKAQQQAEAEIAQMNRRIRELEQQLIQYHNRVDKAAEQLKEAKAELDRVFHNHKKVEKELEYRIQLEKLIANLSTSFINLHLQEIDGAINQTLGAIGKFTGVDRSYVFLLSDRGTTDNTHEWCAEGIEPQIDNLKDVPLEVIPWWMEKLNRFEIIHIPRVADLPPEAASEKAILEEQSIQSVVVLPMFYGQSLLGFLGFDSVRSEKNWSPEVIGLVKIVGEMFVNALKRKWAEEAQRESEERLHLITDNMQDMLCLTDTEFTIRYATPSFERGLGFTPQELEGRSVFELVHPEDLPEVMRNVGKALQEGSDGTAVFRYRHADGHYIWFESSGSLIFGQNGDILGATFANRDITQRIRAKTALEHYAGELQRSNQELQHFASIASHDLQEPLRKILAFGDRLNNHCAQHLDERGKDYLARMQNAARRMQQLIEDLLQFSRVATKAQPFKPVNLQFVIKEVLGDLEELLGQTGGVVQVGNLPSLEADKVQMGQLFQNLIANALKFHKEGELPAISIASRKNGNDLWEISIQDNGIGFDTKYLDRIFRPFQRLHGRGAYEGSGMGLAICHKIVARHRGEITAESAVGQGSTFIVRLPEQQNGEEIYHEP